MATLGILARVNVPDREAVLGAIDRLDGVSSFSVEEEERVGILIEATTTERAHAVLTEQVDLLPGILATWPVFSHFDSEEAASSESGIDSFHPRRQGAGNEQDAS